MESSVVIDQIQFCVERKSREDESEPKGPRGRRNESQSEGLLGRVVVESGGNVRSLFQFVIFQMKLLKNTSESVRS